MARWMLGVMGAAMFLAAGVGCQSGADDTDASEAASSVARPLEVIPAREWGRCWFDLVGAGGQLSCSSTPRGNDPLGAKVEITAAGAGNPAQFVSFQKELDIEAGGTVVLGTFPRTSFPVHVMMHATLTREGSEAVGNHRGVDLWLKPRATRPEDLPSNNPAILKQPFDLWPVGLVDEVSEGRGAFWFESEYEVPLGPLAGFLDQKVMPIRQWFTGADQKAKIRYFAAPAAGAIPIKLHAGNEPRTGTIDRPGYYTVTAGGLRPASPEEIAAGFPTSADGQAPDVEPAPTPDVAPTPAGPVDPTPSCGGPGQARCDGKRCDDGTRWNTNVQTCVACGADGQTYCFEDPNNVSGNWRCNDGTRWNEPSQTCVACGAAGQTYCYENAKNISGNWKCNDGTRWDESAQVCVPCGASGQTACVNSPRNISGSPVCNPGLSYNAGTRTCS